MGSSAEVFQSVLLLWRQCAGWNCVSSLVWPGPIGALTRLMSDGKRMGHCFAETMPSLSWTPTVNSWEAYFGVVAVTIRSKLL